MSRDDRRSKRSASPGPRSDSEGDTRKRPRYSDGDRDDPGQPWQNHWQGDGHPEAHRDLHRDSYREPYRDQPRDSPPRRHSPRRSPSRRDDARGDDGSFHDRRRPEHGQGPRGDFPGPPMSMPGPPAPGGFPPASQGGRGRMGGPPMPPGSSPRGRGNFQAFMAGGRQDFDGGRGNGMFSGFGASWSAFRGRGREFQGRGTFPDGGFRGRRGGYRGRGYEGDFGRRGRGFMHQGRGSFHPAQAPPHLPGAPRPPPVDPAVLERRKQSTARLLRRQLATVELNPDLVDEALYDRFLELKNPQGLPPDRDAAPRFRVEDSFMWDCLGGDEASQEPGPEQRYDQSEAFEYCLQLYQSVSKIQPSKFGHYIV